MDKKLQKYAELIVKKGVNIQKNQILVIEASIEACKLVRKVTDVAYQVGAKEVVVRYLDQHVTRAKFENTDVEGFKEIPTWLSSFKNDYASDGAAFLLIVSDDPEAYKGIDPAKMATWSKHLTQSVQTYRNGLDKGINAWCIAGASSEGWATKVYPDMSIDEAIEALWNAIFKASKVDTTDPLETWDNHRRSFEKRIAYLNEINIDTLTYTNSLGTNITVSMPCGYIFGGGGAKLQNGTYIFPNIPTEEIFSTPDRNMTNGTVYSALPLNYNGNIIDEFYMTFKDGRVVDFGAKKGLDVLTEMLNIDDGAKYLGEVALVPYDSPISNMNTLFYNTLYDENAVCHFAIGKGFADCMKDGMTLTKDELLEKGVNDSLTHVDFMIGTSDLSIVARTHDDKEIVIFKDGNFAF